MYLTIYKFHGQSMIKASILARLEEEVIKRAAILINYIKS